MASLYVIRADLAGDYDGIPRDAVYGYEPTVYADQDAAEARAMKLRETGEWGDDGPPEYRVEEVSPDELKPVELREASAAGLIVSAPPAPPRVNLMHPFYLRIAADNDQDRVACAEWWRQATPADKMAVWDAIQRPYPDDPVQEIVTRFAQLAFSKMALRDQAPSED